MTRKIPEKVRGKFGISYLYSVNQKEFSQLKDYETYRRRLSELLTLIMSRDK